MPPASTPQGFNSHHSRARSIIARALECVRFQRLIPKEPDDVEGPQNMSVTMLEISTGVEAEEVN